MGFCFTAVLDIQCHYEYQAIHFLLHLYLYICS